MMRLSGVMRRTSENRGLGRARAEDTIAASATGVPTQAQPSPTAPASDFCSTHRLLTGCKALSLSASHSAGSDR